MNANLATSKLCLWVICITLTASVTAQVPSGYYSAANGQSGETLKTTLNNIIDGHTEYSYSALWDILKVTDRDPSNSNNVIGLYSRFSMNAAAEYDGGAGWNREHVWAKSRGDFGTSAGAGTDLHHIRASDVSTNSARNNRMFDEGGSIYVDGSGNYSGTTPARTGSGWTWEPGDDQKGDVARMIFYMAVRYEGENGDPDLELTDEVLSNTDKSPVHGRISVLLNWHAQDPVSSEEITRHEAIFSYQNNRNPFIDHPEYVDLIWGSGSGGGGGSTCNNTEVNFTLVTDNYPAETSWTLTQGTTTVASGSGYSTANSTYEETLCLADGSYEFNITDSYGDGICCSYGNGSYTFTQGGTTLISGGQFTSSDTKSFTIGGSSGGGGNSGPTLFISEYIEGSSNNKAIEIGNLTGSSVSLAGYDLRKQTNGAGNWGTPLSLSGSIADGAVYTVVNSNASSSLSAGADLTTTSDALTFNGNDPVGLFKDGTLVDIVGTFSGGSANFAQNTTLVRNSGGASTSYSSSEWDSYNQDTFSYFGSLGTSGGGSTEMPTGYCASAGNNSSYEWLDYVRVGSLINSSGDNGGYQDYTAQSVNLSTGSSVNFELRPGFSGSSYQEAYRIWIDFNRDGDFEDSGELVVNQGLTSSSSVSGSFTVPGSVSAGTTRMRVSMKYNGSPTTCESFSYGEVEDYAVVLSGSGAARGEQYGIAFEGEPDNISLGRIYVFPSPAKSSISATIMVDQEGVYPVSVYDLSGKEIYKSEVESFRLKLSGKIDVSDWKPGIYMLHAGGNTAKFSVK